MAKWSGKIGYAITKQTDPGVWEEEIIEKCARGDSLMNHGTIDNSGTINPKISLSNKISVVADPFALSNCSYIRYVTYMGTKWKVKNAEISRPRLILTLGEEYEDGNK